MSPGEGALSQSIEPSSEKAERREGRRDVPLVLLSGVRAAVTAAAAPGVAGSVAGMAVGVAAGAAVDAVVGAAAGAEVGVAATTTRGVLLGNALVVSLSSDMPGAIAASAPPGEN